MMGLAMFYCDGNFAEKSSSRYILGSIARQLFPTPLDPTGPHFKHLERLFNLGCSRAISISELTTTITWLSRSFNTVYIVVDGLDECSDRTSICRAISELAQENIKVLATSRPETDIASSFSAVKQLEVEETFAQADLAIYIDWRLEHNERLKIIKPALKHDIKANLLSKSQGM